MQICRRNENLSNFCGERGRKFFYTVFTGIENLKERSISLSLLLNNPDTSDILFLIWTEIKKHRRRSPFRRPLKPVRTLPRAIIQSPSSFLSARASCARVVRISRLRLHTFGRSSTFSRDSGFLDRARSAREPHANAIDDRASRRAFRAMH